MCHWLVEENDQLRVEVRRQAVLIALLRAELKRMRADAAQEEAVEQATGVATCLS